MAEDAPRALRVTYVERWSGVRLWIFRTRSGRLSYSITRRGSDNVYRVDSQLARGDTMCAPGSWASRSLLHALLAALVSSYGPAMVATALSEVRQELELGAPSGGQGGYATDPLTGPLP